MSAAATRFVTSRSAATRSAAMRRVRVFGRLLGIEVVQTVQYRGEFFLLQVRTMLVPIVSLVVWQAALAGGAQLPVTPAYLATYFVFVSLVSMLTSSWTAGFLAESIRLGELARWLVRPVSTHLNGVANNVGEKIVKILLISPLIVAVALALGERVQVPSDPGRWVLFALSMMLAATMVYASDVLVGALAFWFDEVAGFDRARSLIVGVLSGATVPLALMPGWAGGVLAVQPFRFTVSFPLEVLLGAGTGSGQLSSIGAGFAAQLGWTAVFVVSAAVVWRRGLRSYAAAGA